MKITYNLITPEILTPVKNNSESEVIERIRAHKRSVLSTFSDYLITVLEERRKALFLNFLRHTDDIIFDDGNYAEYVRKDKTHGFFSKTEFEDMADGIRLLQDEAFEDFLGCETIIKQCLMGIPFVERPEDMSGKPKFSDLMRLLTQ
jgi:hypothetical protein